MYHHPRDRDEEAGFGDDSNGGATGAGGGDDLALAESLIEEPLEEEAIARKDVVVRDGSGSGSGILLGSITSFNREIPVVRILSSDEHEASTSASTSTLPGSDLESQVVDQREILDGGVYVASSSGGGGSDGDGGGDRVGDRDRDQDERPSTSTSTIREEAELSGSEARTFKRPEVIPNLTLPSTPTSTTTSTAAAAAAATLEKLPTRPGDESEEESEGEAAAEEEVTKLLTSPLAGTVLSKTKARLQEPPPITPAVKDQIADSLHLKRATTMAEGAGVHPDQSQQHQQQHPVQPGETTPGSFKQPTSPLAKQPSIQAAQDEDDPLEDSIIPEYKEKLKRDESFFWVVCQWVCFVLLVTLLICSVNIKVVRDITWLGDNIWRWQAVALVIFSGRLIAGWAVQAFVLLIEKRFLFRKRVLYFVYGLRKSVKNCIWLALVITIWETVFIERESKALRVITRILWCIFTICLSWMLKVLAVKVAANGFHRSAYFERIQECLFNQYLLATLSAPPTMQITADPNAGEELITSRYNPNSPNKIRRMMTRIPSGQEAPIGDPSPRLQQAPIIARSANPIEQDKLQQLTSENVSAWTLKSLMKLIRKKNLASYSSQLTRNEGEWEIDSEVRAKAAAKQIFYNIARPGRKYLMLRDFLYFLPEDKATRAFALFEATESGTITKKAFVKWVVNVYKERRALALTLNDNKTVVAKLHRVLNAVLGIGLIIVSLLILGVETAKLLVFFSSIFIPCVFIFGNAARTTFEALLFLFILHPYDVGDRVSIDGTMMLVEEMNVLNTVFLGPTNEKIYYPNVILGTKYITNYYRSPDQWDGIEFQIHMNTPLEKLGTLKERMQRYVDSQPQFWYPDFGLMCKDIDDCNKMKMGYYFQHHLNYHEAGERYKRRSNMLLYMKQQMEDLEISYQLPSQEVIVTGIPAFSIAQQPQPGNVSPSKLSPTKVSPHSFAK